eukprot:2077343-Amphidinium_carterae.1
MRRNHAPIPGEDETPYPKIVLACFHKVPSKSLILHSLFIWCGGFCVAESYRILKLPVVQNFFLDCLAEMILSFLA